MRSINNRTNSGYIQVDPEKHTFRISRGTFTDFDVLEREKDNIFEKCWLYLGHGSEVAEPGDFVTRSVGGRELIFNRDVSGKVHALYNTCPHRGMRVCRELNGNAKLFVCFYHGWAFQSDGTLRGIPGKDAYAPDFGTDGSTNLVPVARLEQYRDFWFVCFNPNVVSLENYLGSAKEMLSLVADQSAEGMQIIRGAQNYGIRANWKLIMENSLDSYHAPTTHATYLDYLRNANADFGGQDFTYGVCLDLGNGHAALEYGGPFGRPVAKPSSVLDEAGNREIERVFEALKKRVGPERAERIGRKNRNIGIFPNLVINDTMGLVIRTFYPVEAGLMHVNSWTMAPKEEPELVRKFRLTNFIEFLGPGGFATPDDVEALENCQKGFRNRDGAPWSDISRGMARPFGEQKVDDESQMRLFWSKWDEYMSLPQAAE